MADRFMYIPNDDAQNYTTCILQLMIETFGHFTETTNQNLIKVPKVVKQTKKKTLLLNVGD